jgi:hypothetical protein
MAEIAQPLDHTVYEYALREVCTYCGKRRECYRNRQSSRYEPFTATGCKDESRCAKEMLMWFDGTWSEYAKSNALYEGVP